MKGLRVLECVARSQKPRGASDIAAELGMTKSNAYRTLQTLVAARYITRQDDQPVYAPTSKLYELGSLVVETFEVKAISHRILQEVVRRAGEDVVLSVLDGAEAVMLDREESPHVVRSTVPVGHRLPTYCSTTGKVLLAYAPEELIDSLEEIMVRHTEFTITTLPELRAELKKIREQGYATVRGEWNLQLNGVAVPIQNGTGTVVAALGISGPAERFKPKQMRAHLKVAQWAAEEFRSQLST